MPALYAEGGNYRIELDGTLATCRVWRRPDVDGATGAGWAHEKIAHFDALAGRGCMMLFDLRDAPPVTGPKTQAALGEMISAFERAGRRVALVAGSNAVQQMQLQRIVQDAARAHGRVFTSDEDARAWLLGR